jgi:hypothetical protein
MIAELKYNEKTKSILVRLKRRQYGTTQSFK